MILIVVKIVLILIEEGDGVVGTEVVLLGILRRSEELGEIVAILLGVHDIEVGGSELEASPSADVDARGHRVTALRGDAEDTVGTFGTVERNAIAEHLDVFDVFRVDEIEDIVEEAIVDGTTVELHIPDYAIDDDEGLGVGVEGVDAVDEHHGPLGSHSATGYRADGGVELIVELILEGDGRGRVEGGVGSVEDIDAIGVEGTETLGIDVGIGSLVATDAHLHGVVAFGGDIEGGDVFGNADDVFTVFVGHGGVAVVGKRLHAHTGEGLTGAGIIDDAADVFHDVLRSVGLLLLGSRSFGLFRIGGRNVVLRESLADAEEHKEADTGAKSSLLYLKVSIICLHSV